MDLCPRCQFGLILRLETLFAIPPGAAAIEIISNVRGAYHRHILTTGCRLRKFKYSTNFLIFILGRGRCETFLTYLAKTFLEDFLSWRIMKA
jgi:hypothetical protein